MSDALRLALAALACYRLAQLVTIDDGPLDVCRRLRAWTGSLSNDTARGLLGGVTHCPFCASVWLAVPLVAMATWPTAGGDLILVWLGIAGAAAWLQGPREVG